MAETEVIVDTHTEKLTVRLTDEARMLRAKQLASAHQELVQKIDERKALVSALAAQEKEIAASIGALSAAVIAGIEPADVEVKGYVDFTNGLVRYRRTDTGEEIKTRAIREEERQMEVPGTEAIRATICQHLTAKPTNGTLPRYCKTCADAQGDEPRPPLKIVDYADGEQQGETEAAGSPPAEEASQDDSEDRPTSEE